MINFSVNSLVAADKLKTTIHWGNNVPSTFSGVVETMTSFRKSEEKTGYRLPSIFVQVKSS